MRAIIKLTEAEKKKLKELKKAEKNNKIYRRLLYIEMSNKKMTNLKISLILGITNDTLTDWKIIFEEGGFKELCKLHYEGRRTSKLEKYKKDIENLEKDKGFSRLKDLQNWLKKEHNVETCISNLFYFCKKNSIFPTRKQD